MTKLTPPTETLIRIPFSGLTDFQPLALAPGLPMLDVNKLTYQILLGWFGDLLAEPDLGDEGVAFYAQQNGRRQVIVDRALVTREDLDGPLQSEFERLKKSLFDVRPVSPSERLIFNRLQPPISNHEGFLYRVRTENNSEQLVWCWGFQRRTQYGEPTLCASSECSMLFLHDELAEPDCPHCGVPFNANVADRQPVGSRFSIASKTSVAAALVVLAGGTLWIGSHFSNLSADTVPEVTDVDQSQPNNGVAPYEDATATDTDNRVATTTDNSVSASKVVGKNGSESDDAKAAAEKPQNEPPELLVTFNNFPDVSVSESDSDADSNRSGLTFPGDALPSVVSLPDLPALSKPTIPDTVPGEPDGSLPLVNADSFPQDKSAEVPDLPEVLPEPLVAKSEPQQSKSKPFTAALDKESDRKIDAQPATRPDISRPSVSEPGSSVALIDPSATPSTVAKTDTVKPMSPANNPEALTWHSDYLAAYQEASQEKRYLLMLFRESVVGGNTLTPTGSFFAPTMRPMLEQFSRVELPLNAAIPANSEPGDTDYQSDLPDLLLKHRSFRHLGMRSGIAVVDLTDSESANHARVVSVLPLPENGFFDNDSLMLALKLPYQPANADVYNSQHRA
jgi:hypothetical protein